MCVRAPLYIYIWLEIRKEAGHEQWLAAFRNNVVFVGSFYLPAAQECSLQSASKFIPMLRNAIGPPVYFVIARLLLRGTKEFKDTYSSIRIFVSAVSKRIVHRLDI